MPREINPNPSEVNRTAAPQPAPAPAGKNLRVLHDYVSHWPKGHVIGANEVPQGMDVKRLVALGAVAETDDPATGALDPGQLPPGAAVTHQLAPGDELPPNALERVDPEREKAVADANAKAIAEQSGAAKGGK